MTVVQGGKKRTESEALKVKEEEGREIDWRPRGDMDEQIGTRGRSG